MDRPVSLDSFLAAYPSERGSADRPLALWPLVLVIAIVVFIVWASHGRSTPDEHAASPYLQARMAP